MTEGWAPVKDAAAATSVPVRTLFRWVSKGLVPTREADGVALVEIVAVAALASERRSGKGVTAATPASAPPADVSLAPPSPSDGEVAATVFAEFEKGVSPALVVSRLRLPPQIVRALHRDWLDLRALTVDAPDGARRVAALERDLATLRVEHSALVKAHTELLARHREIADYVSGLPTPSRQHFKCDQCGGTGFPVALLRCGRCRAVAEVGFWEER